MQITICKFHTPLFSSEEVKQARTINCKIHPTQIWVKLKRKYKLNNREKLLALGKETVWKHKIKTHI